MSRVMAAVMSLFCMCVSFRGEMVQLRSRGADIRVPAFPCKSGRYRPGFRGDSGRAELSAPVPGIRGQRPPEEGCTGPVQGAGSSRRRLPGTVRAHSAPPAFSSAKDYTMHRKTGAERAVAFITALGVLIPATPFGALAVAWSDAQAKPAATGAPAKPPAPSAATTPAANDKAAAKPAAPAADAPPIDGGWPRMYDLASGGSLLVYQPQVSSWKDQKHMVAFSAVSYRDKAAEKPAYGTLRMEADTSVSLTDRLVSFKNLRIDEATFQTLSKEQVREVAGTIEKVMSPDERVIALDRVLVNIDKSQIVPKNVEGIKADPPSIFFTPPPAVIVNIDSQPIWSPIKDNDLKFAVNTNWDLFQHEPTKTFYLRNDTSWLKATAVAGPW